MEGETESISIQGTDYNEVIDNEYIVTIHTLKLKGDPAEYSDKKETVAKEFRDYIQKNVPNGLSAIRNVWIFPNYVIVRVSLDAEDVHYLQEHPLVTSIETSHTLHVAAENVTVNDRTCVFQDTGHKLWGLSRIASREPV